jgi:hypothetical protein
MRYAEVLLMAAEAYLMSNDHTNALKCINEVRSRAKLNALTSVTLDDIKKEKRLELCNEGVRYQDLVRWGDAKSVLANQGAKVPSLSTTGVVWPVTNQNYGFKDKNMLLPIPLKETELNSNIQQNNGWN